jgi:hypothetical protein
VYRGTNGFGTDLAFTSEVTFAISKVLPDFE